MQLARVLLLGISFAGFGIMTFGISLIYEPAAIVFGGAVLVGFAMLPDWAPDQTPDKTRRDTSAGKVTLNP